MNKAVIVVRNECILNEVEWEAIGLTSSQRLFSVDEL